MFAQKLRIRIYEKNQVLTSPILNLINICGKNSYFVFNKICSHFWTCFHPANFEFNEYL